MIEKVKELVEKALAENINEADFLTALQQLLAEKPEEEQDDKAVAEETFGYELN